VNAARAKYAVPLPNLYASPCVLESEPDKKPKTEEEALSVRDRSKLCKRPGVCSFLSR